MVRPTEIVVHQSDSTDGPQANVEPIFDWHIQHNGWQDVGYHALVERIGSRYFTILGRPWNMDGAHTIGHNSQALGICLVGDFTKTPPPDDQLAEAAKRVRFWMWFYDIPLERVYRHSDLNKTECPGLAFPWEKFKGLLA